MNNFFLEPYEHSCVNEKVELDQSNYATKASLKEATSMEVSALTSKIDLASFKFKIDNLNLDKRKIFPANLIKLGNKVDNDVVKKTVYDKLVISVNATDNKIPSTSRLVNKTQYDFYKQGLVRKIEDVDKKYLILVGKSRRLITTQKVKR